MVNRRSMFALLGTFVSGLFLGGRAKAAKKPTPLFRRDKDRWTPIKESEVLPGDRILLIDDAIEITLAKFHGSTEGCTVTVDETGRCVPPGGYS